MDESQVHARLESIEGFDLDFAMRMANNQIGFLAKLLELFLKTHRDEASNLRIMADARDSEEIRRAAHRLKGAAGALGATGISKQADRVQTLLRRDSDIPVFDVERLADETEKFVAALELAVDARQKNLNV